MPSNYPCINLNEKGAYTILYLFCSLVSLNIVITCYRLDFFDILSVTAMRCCNYKVLKQAIKLRPYLTLSLKSSNSMVIELNILNIIPQLQLLHHKSGTLYPYTAMTPKNMQYICRGTSNECFMKRIANINRIPELEWNEEQPRAHLQCVNFHLCSFAFLVAS